MLPIFFQIGRFLHICICHHLCDQVLLLKLGTPEFFLSQCLQPPSLEQVRQAIATLLEVRAVLPIPSIPLTALGYHLARMPVDVRIGKMLIYASLLQVS